jgi:hypothetical protein
LGKADEIAEKQALAEQELGGTGKATLASMHKSLLGNNLIQRNRSRLWAGIGAEERFSHKKAPSAQKKKRNQNPGAADSLSPFVMGLVFDFSMLKTSAIATVSCFFRATCCRRWS